MTNEELQQHVRSGKLRPLRYLVDIPGTEHYVPELISGRAPLNYMSPWNPAPPIQCVDGFSVSVQASVTAYCTPRNNFGPYTHMELGFPSHVDELIMSYVDDDRNPLDTVYGRVPVEVILQLINKHGGVVK